MSVADTPDLLREARNGDNEACARLIEENAGSSGASCAAIMACGADPEDLYQLGCLGFLKAVRGFGPGPSDASSPRMPVPKIAGEIRRFLRMTGR